MRADMRNKERVLAAENAARVVLQRIYKLAPRVGLIFGTGWGDVLTKKFDFMTEKIDLQDLPGFQELAKMPKIEGHRRELVYGSLDFTPAVMLCGRIHMNETHNGEELAKMARLQVEMLIMLGVEHLILTNAAGSLDPKVKVGDVVAHDGFITLFAPPLPLWAGEFVSPEDTLKPENNQKIMEAAEKAGLDCHLGAGAMVRGPFFEGRKHDKRILRQSGATMAMMSILPEAAVAALYPDVKVYAVSFITNTDSEEHSHEENQARAKASSEKLGNLLLNLISSL